MKAVIIADQEGNRLRPITCTKPKCMLPVLGRPVAEHILRLLRRHNITDVIFITGYLSGEVKKYFDQNSDSFNISYAKKDELAGIIYSYDTIIISGSLISDIDLDDFLSFHKKRKSQITIAVRAHSCSDYGAVSVDSNLNVSFKDNIHYDESFTSYDAFIGIMAINKGTGTDFSSVWKIPRSVWEKQGSVSAYITKSYVCDICDIDSYMKCNRDFLEKKIGLPFPCDEKEPGVWISKEANISQGIVIVPPVFIGESSNISRGVRIEAYSVIGKNVTIGEGASTKRSIIMDNARLGKGCSLRGSILCDNSYFGSGSAAYENSITGEKTKLGKHCTVRPAVRIWPEKNIDDEMCVSSNVVWEHLGAEKMFDEGFISGKTNIEITPELAASLGSTVGAFLGDKIAVSSDGSGGSSMIKNALISGIQAVGSVAYDFGEQPLPITRSGIKFHSLDGGIALSSYQKDGEDITEIDIINPSGSNIENNELEIIRRMLSYSEPVRCKPNEISEPEYLFEYKLYYLKQLINSTTKKELGIRLLINAPSAWAKNLLKSAANDLKCDLHFTKDSTIPGFCREMQKNKYDFGAIIDHKCETLTLVTHDGHVVSEFEYDALASLIIMKLYKNAVIYTPLSSPDSIEETAKKYGAEIHRTKLSPPHLMNELAKHDGEMFSKQFIFHFDAVGSLVMLTDFICKNETSLTELLGELPTSFIINTEVGCPSSKQDEIIEKLSGKLEKSSTGSDNMKFSFDDGWVMLIPKKNRSVIRIISQGLSEEYARELSDICVDDITKS